MFPSRSLLCTRTVYPTVIITSHFAHHKDTPVLIYLQPMSCLVPSNLVLLCCFLFFIPVNGITSIQFCNPNSGVIFVIFLSSHIFNPYLCLVKVISYLSNMFIAYHLHHHMVTCIKSSICLEYCHSF